MNNVISKPEVAVVKKIDNRKEYFKDIAFERLGETIMSKAGSICWIDEYNSADDVVVQFKDNDYKAHVTYQQFTNQHIKNPNDKTVYGVGCLGVGSHHAYVNGKATIAYATWQNMLTRCYNAKFQTKQPAYIGCSVSEDWLNFQHYATWYDNNFYEIPGLGRTECDKDILIKGNKVYSASTCVFVPHSINMLFVNRDSKRGNTPIGTYLHKSGKYQAQCNIGNGKPQYLGLFDTPELAFNAYKEFKQGLIKTVAESYKDQIPQKLYNAMITYEVSIDD